MLYHYWAGLPTRERQLWQLCSLAGALFLFHFMWFSNWYVEDAAISFSFARNAALGEGFVAYPGGERVEGFSNPTWTLLLTAGEWLGLNSWFMAKLWGAVFGLLGLPISLAWVHHIRPGKNDLLPALAPLFLAMSPQYVLWASSGLENPLLATAMGFGGLLMLKEIRDGGTPWSGCIWAIVAITRPEAPLYAFVAGVVGGVAVLSTHGWRRVLRWAPRWLLLCAIPFILWHSWRWLYFAWEFPNTYYAKLGNNDRFLPWSWTKQGWKYLREYALVSGTGFWLWLYAIGQTGWTRWRKWVVFSIILINGVLFIPGLEWPRLLSNWLHDNAGLPTLWPILTEAHWWTTLRISVLLFTFALLPLIGAGRRGWAGRWLAWSLCGTVLFFTLYSGWDWMQGYRWLSFCAIPMAVLLTDALALLYDHSKNKPFRGWLYIKLPAALVFCISITTTIWYINSSETSPFDVNRRVRYMQEVQKRIHLDHASLLEVDMGAHMWWSGFELIDMAGLIDVPMGHHKWDKPFIKEYVFEERNPTFAHVHGSWASKTKMKTHKEWRRYLPIDPYPTGRRFHHSGNHIRKDLIVKSKWPGSEERSVVFDGWLRLHGWSTPSSQAVPGESLYLEVGFSKERNQADFRVVVFLSNGKRTISKELPPGYDWYPPRRWKNKKEVVMGFHAINLPQDLPVGSYDLGFVVYDRHGHRAVVEAPENATLVNPIFSRNEVRWKDAIEIMPEADALASGKQRLTETLQQAHDGNCEDAEASWRSTRRIVGDEHPWALNAKRQFNDALGVCWAHKASTAATGDETLRLIRKARRLAHRHPMVLQHAEEIAIQSLKSADDARKNKDLEAEYQQLRLSLTANPSQSWIRRRAEALRDKRLGIAKKP